MITVAVLLGGFFAFAAAKAVQARHPVRTGWEELIGADGVVRVPLDPVGQVFVEERSGAPSGGGSGAGRPSASRRRRSRVGRGLDLRVRGREPRGGGAQPDGRTDRRRRPRRLRPDRLASAIRILREYERGVIFRLGRLIAQKGPGLILLIPIIDQMVEVDLRTVTLNVPPQEVITRDNVTVRVNAVAYFRVVDPNKAVTEVENYLLATSQIAQTTLRSVLGQAELDELLAERERLNTSCSRSSTSRPSRGGSRSRRSRSRTSSCPPTCSGRWRARPRPSASGGRRSSTPTASSRRPRSSPRRPRSSAANPATLQLRYLQTLLEIGVNQNTTIVFPLPIDLFKPFARGHRSRRPPGDADQARLA